MNPQNVNNTSNEILKHPSCGENIKAAESRPMGHPRRRLMKLEAMRGFASVYVVLFHCRSFGGALRQVFGYGYIAVMLFFILSGFVMFYSTTQSNHGFYDYLRRRFRRIYPIFLVALAFTYVSNCIVDHRIEKISFQKLIGNILLIQDSRDHKAGVWVDVFGGNTPLWSLSYEWWFYLLFYPVIVFVAEFDDIQRWIAFILSAIGLISYLTNPNEASLILSYFYIWWAGVELAKEFMRRGRITFGGQSVTLLMLATLASLWTAAYLLLGATEPDRVLIPMQHSISAFCVVLAGVTWARLKFMGFAASIGWFVTIAPISYALYVLHMPALRYGELSLLATHPLLKLLIIPGSLVALAYGLEVQLQSKLARICDKLFSYGRRLGGVCGVRYVPAVLSEKAAAAS